MRKLTSTPYFADPSDANDSLGLHAGSSRERIRETDEATIEVPEYRIDRIPLPRDPEQRFGGGLGTATVRDVSAHPIRARLRHFDVLTVVAVSFVAAVAIVILTLVATFRY